ncbi:MAG TPA: iron-sulfur cluster repair di-iron protein [Tepidisphaeraceae bacterium]|nr:iron-sulfur cluster repair di-iron protein [Tepidisphaeraceae bacterium]
MNLIETTVGELVAQRPGRARVFEHFGIDYCCGGKKLLAAACREKGIDLLAIENAINAADQEVVAESTNWTTAPISELANHIEQTHHAYLKTELPRLEAKLKKIASVHADAHPEMVRVFEIFTEFKAELESHMGKEEMILFPLCRRLESAMAPVASHCGSVQNPIRVMIAEHDHAGNALEQMRALTHDYTAPADACNTFRATMHDLEKLEQDMHQHVHKENNILFPRAIEAERVVGV